MYGIDTAFGIVLGIAMLTGLAILSVLLYFRPLNFGEYKDFFERDNMLKYNYYIVVVVIRLLLGIGISALNESNACLYMTLSICLIQLILVLVIRPYARNIRPVLNSFVMLFTVTVYAVYRLSITDDA